MTWKTKVGIAAIGLLGIYYAANMDKVDEYLNKTARNIVYAAKTHHAKDIGEIVDRINTKDEVTVIETHTLCGPCNEMKRDVAFKNLKNWVILNYGAYKDAHQTEEEWKEFCEKRGDPYLPVIPQIRRYHQGNLTEIHIGWSAGSPNKSYKRDEKKKWKRIFIKNLDERLSE